MSRDFLLVLMVVLFVASIALFIYFFSLMKTMKQKKIVEESDKHVSSHDDGEDDFKLDISEEDIKEEEKRVSKPIELDEDVDLEKLKQEKEVTPPVYVTLDIDEEMEEPKDEFKITVPEPEEVKEEIKVEVPEEEIKITVPEEQEEVKVVVPETNNEETEFDEVEFHSHPEEKIEEPIVVQPVNNMEDVVNVSIKDKSYVFLANGNHLEKNDEIILSLKGKDYRGVITRGNYQKDISTMKIQPKDLVVVKKIK